MTDTLAFALAAGLVAAVNPCGFALLPAYLTLVVLGEERDGVTHTRGVAVVRALAATLAMTLGFLAVFGAFGLLIAPVAASTQQYLPVVTMGMGVILVVVGGWLVSGRELRLAVPRLRGVAPTGRLRSMVLYGVGYALASLSCTAAPFLDLTASTFQAGDPVVGLAAYGAYGAGMGLLVGVLAVGLALAGSTVTVRLRRVLPYVSRIGGALVLVVGCYITYYGLYELRLFHFDGDPSDPLVDTASRVQSWLVSTVDRLGWQPLAVTLVILTVAGVIATNVTRSRNRTGRTG